MIFHITYYISVKSNNGWKTESKFEQYLKFLRSNFNDNEKIYLIVDKYKAHQIQKIYECANHLNIELLFIPSSLTDELHPLDRLVFGRLKANAIRLFKKSYQNIVKNQNNILLLCLLFGKKGKRRYLRKLINSKNSFFWFIILLSLP